MPLEPAACPCSSTPRAAVTPYGARIPGEERAGDPDDRVPEPHDIVSFGAIWDDMEHPVSFMGFAVRSCLSPPKALKTLCFQGFFFLVNKTASPGLYWRHNPGLAIIHTHLLLVLFFGAFSLHFRQIGLQLFKDFFFICKWCCPWGSLAPGLRPTHCHSLMSPCHHSSKQFT